MTKEEAQVVKELTEIISETADSLLAISKLTKEAATKIRVRLEKASELMGVRTL